MIAVAGSGAIAATTTSCPAFSGLSIGRTRRRWGEPIPTEASPTTNVSDDEYEAVVAAARATAERAVEEQTRQGKTLRGKLCVCGHRMARAGSGNALWCRSFSSFRRDPNGLNDVEVTDVVSVNAEATAAWKSEARRAEAAGCRARNGHRPTG